MQHLKEYYLEETALTAKYCCFLAEMRNDQTWLSDSVWKFCRNNTKIDSKRPPFRGTCPGKINQKEKYQLFFNSQLIKVIRHFLYNRYTNFSSGFKSYIFD